MNKKQFEQIKNMYLSGITIEEISEETGFDVQLIDQELAPVKMLTLDHPSNANPHSTNPHSTNPNYGLLPTTTYMRYKGRVVTKAESSAMTLLQNQLNRYLEHIDNPDSLPPSAEDLMNLTSIVEKLDKINRLEHDRPTNIVQSNQKLSHAQIREIIISDPFNPVTTKKLTPIVEYVDQSPTPTPTPDPTVAKSATVPHGTNGNLKLDLSSIEAESV